ncbi:MAG: hypothetical protein HQL19_07980 [Candidatus Omnitrophica bacterium]|nr:hypothetical protein [Candidatus Omnitrophota bacterium]
MNRDTEDLKLFKKYFEFRKDTFAFQQRPGKNGKTPYYRQKRALTDKDIIAHISGRQTVGVYLIDPQGNTVRGVVLDWDLLSFDEVSRLVSAAKKLGIRAGQMLIEFSGKKGYHVWIFFLMPVAAAAAHKLGNMIVAESGLNKMEVFPKQGDVQEKFGNLIKLPFGIHKGSNKRSYPVDQDGKKIEDWRAHLSSREFIGQKQWDKLCQALELNLEDGPESDAKNAVANDAMEEVVKKYGQPYYLSADQKSVIGINQAFWAGLHAAEHILVYEPDEKAFYRYDEKSGLYQAVSEDVLKKEISSRILEMSRSSSPSSLERKRSSSVLDQVIDHLKGICERRGAFRRDKKIIHLANGVVVFRENSDADFCEFSPEFFSRNQSPISYDPSATCPKFLDEFLRPAVTPDDLVLIQKYFGMCLLGDNLIQRMMIFDGLAGRGKSTASLILQMLIGMVNVTQLRTKHLDSRFELFRYLKKTLLVGVDVPGNFLSESGAQGLKGLVGGDMLDAEMKNGVGCHTFLGNLCVVITCNSRLHVFLEGDSGAWKRRILIVRFESPAPKKIVHNLAQKLIAEEGPGILNFALEGLSLLLKEIDDTGSICLTADQEGIVDALLAESDGVRHFLQDMVVRDDRSDLTSSEILEGYAAYCPEKKWHPKPTTVVQKELDSLMLELFRTTRANSIMRDGKSVKGFRNVGFKNQDGCA